MNTIKNIILLITMIAIVSLMKGCSSLPFPKKDVAYLPNVHPKIRPYVLKFNKYYKKFRHSGLDNSIVVKFEPIPNSKKAGGVYYRVKDFTIISSTKWPHFSETTREMVVFHELGHHVLKRGHDWSGNKMLKSNCEISIMYYKGVSDSCFIKYRKFYLNELFLSYK